MRKPFGKSFRSLVSRFPGSRLSLAHRASSTIETYEQLDHTFLYSSSMLDAISLYEEFPSLVKVVLGQGDDVQKCVAYNAPGKEILLSEEDVVLGGKITGYQFDSLVGTHTVRISKEELSNNDRDPLSTELRDDYQVRPYGYKALAPISGSHSKRTYPATCVRRNDSDSGIPIWKLFEWQPKDAVSVHPVSIIHTPQLTSCRTDTSLTNSWVINLPYHLTALQALRACLPPRIYISVSGRYT